jgi:hypothetical protein
VYPRVSNVKLQTISENKNSTGCKTVASRILGKLINDRTLKIRKLNDMVIKKPTAITLDKILMSLCHKEPRTATQTNPVIIRFKNSEMNVYLLRLNMGSLLSMKLLIT